MRQDAVVWRADLAARAVVRDSTLQAVPALQSGARIANWWGGPGVIWFAAALWLGGRAIRRRAVARAGLRGAEALAVASAVSGIIKGLAGRARPFVDGSQPWHWEFNHGWSDARFFSMPSGHTTATVAFVVGAVVGTRGWPLAARVAIAVPLVLSAIAVPLGRLYADQHWLSDVLVATGLGALTAVALARVHARHPRSRYEQVMLGRSPAVGEGGVA